MEKNKKIKKKFKKQDLEELIDKDGAIIDGDDKPNQYQVNTGSKSTTDDVVNATRQQGIQGRYAWAGFYGIGGIGVGMGESVEQIQRNKFIDILNETDKEKSKHSAEFDKNIDKSELNFHKKIFAKTNPDKIPSHIKDRIKDLESKTVNEQDEEPPLENRDLSREDYRDLEPTLASFIMDAPLFHRTCKYMIDMGNTEQPSGDVLYAGFYNILKSFDFSTLLPEQKEVLVSQINK